MSEKAQRYKVTNTTQWPNQKKGKHRRGFIISIGQSFVHPNKHTFVDKVSESLEGLQARNFIRIDVVSDHVVSIKKQIEAQQKKNDKQFASQTKQEIKDLEAEGKDLTAATAASVEKLGQAQENSTPQNSFDKDALKQQIKSEKTGGKAIVQDIEKSEDPLADLEQPSNDQPNFVVQAGRKNKNK